MGSCPALTPRSVQWSIILEEARRDNPKEFNADRPWDFVIGASAFGVSHGVRHHWWWLHVTGPLSTSGGSGAAMSTADAIDGRPQAKNEESGPKRQKTNKERREPVHPVASVKSKVCYNWNNGGCTEPCSKNMRHVCQVCGNNHRGIECWHKNGSGASSSGGTEIEVDLNPGELGARRGKIRVNRNPPR